jgi:hypothetical protein
MLAAGVVALHFLVVRVPPSRVLPTARFVPAGRVAARVVTEWPRSWLLMALRVALLLLVGAGFARPRWSGRRVPVARVVVVDSSDVVASAVEVRDSAARWTRGGDTVVVFDSSLSAGLIAGERAAGVVRRRADSVEVVLVSPVTVGEVDAATGSVRRLWPGAIRVARVAARSAPPAGPVRVVRGVRPSRADVDWVQAGADARALVWWPDSLGLTGKDVRVDTVGGLVVGDAVAVGLFRRPAAVLHGQSVVARWADGRVAAVEDTISVSGGCERMVLVSLPDGRAGMRADVRRVVAALTGPCRAEWRRGLVPASDSVVRALAGSGASTVPAAMVVGDEGERPSALAAWCLVLALVAAGAEWAVRRRAAA